MSRGLLPLVVFLAMVLPVGAQPGISPPQPWPGEITLPGPPAPNDLWPQSLTLVQNRIPKATIVVAKEPTRAAAFAAWEIQQHIHKITGAKLPIKDPGQPTTGPRLLVGPSAATAALGVNPHFLARQQYVIRFFPPRDIVILGRDARSLPGPDVHVYRAVHSTPHGLFGRSLMFSGDGAVRAGPCHLPDSEGTIEAYVYPLHPDHYDPERQEMTILRIEAPTGGYRILRCKHHKFQYLVYSGDPDNPETPGVSSDEYETGRWYHVAAVHRGNTLKLYVGPPDQPLQLCGQAELPAGASTACDGGDLWVGGILGANGKIGNPFRGKIDEVRVSDVARDFSGQGPQGPYTPDQHTTLLFHFDEPEAQWPPRDSRRDWRIPPPPFEDQGTSYAAHDFLERFCRVRWYTPGELGTVYPTTATLSLSTHAINIKRRPALLYRWPVLLNYMSMIRRLWDRPSPWQLKHFFARLRLGGEPYACNHSFGGYYDRFWKPNEEVPWLWEGAHPDWFAKGYESAERPPQMCYTNGGLVQQVVQDAKAYFDNGVLKPRAVAMGDYFAVAPLDNRQWCKCGHCQSRLDPAEAQNPQFSRGYASDYIFDFVRRVAEPLRFAYPGKFISTLAYADYAYHPRSVTLPQNVSVQMSLHVRNWYALCIKQNDLRLYHEWLLRDPGRRFFVKLYYFTPELVARGHGFKCFPGFFAHMAADQIKMFARDGIRGAYVEGPSCHIDFYVTFKLMDDPTIPINHLLHELFHRYYGPAGLPMWNFYSLVEKTYCDPANYPHEVAVDPREAHQTAEIAWKHLGTDERMQQLQQFMHAALHSAQTETEKRRVALFKTAVWDEMEAGWPQGP